MVPNPEILQDDEEDNETEIKHNKSIEIDKKNLDINP